KKVSPYYCEFLVDDYEPADAIVVVRDQILDLLILDIEKLENRKERTEDAAEKTAIDKVMAGLEQDVPVCDQELTEEELEIIKILAPLSLKPTLILDDATADISTLVPQAMEKAGVMFFYTAGKQEVRSWFVDCGSDAVTCAGKIHSDLARGFVKAEIIPVEELLECHNLQDARSKGLTKLVDRTFEIPRNTVLEIRFNV
ncbi:MAG: DUF933 domain-containing protein, partial [Verrucomicrobiota bacterium]